MLGNIQRDSPAKPQKKTTGQHCHKQRSILAIIVPSAGTSMPSLYVAPTLILNETIEGGWIVGPDDLLIHHALPLPPLLALQTPQNSVELKVQASSYGEIKDALGISCTTTLLRFCGHCQEIYSVDRGICDGRLAEAEGQSI